MLCNPQWRILLGMFWLFSVGWDINLRQKKEPISRGRYFPMSVSFNVITVLLLLHEHIFWQALARKPVSDVRETVSFFFFSQLWFSDSNRFMTKTDYGQVTFFYCFCDVGLPAIKSVVKWELWQEIKIEVFCAVPATLYDFPYWRMWGAGSKWFLKWDMLFSAMKENNPFIGNWYFLKSFTEKWSYLNN